jgi:hypothetical protein
MISAHLEVVLILTQDRRTVCIEQAIGSKSFWTHPIELLGCVGHVDSHFFPLWRLLVSVQDRITVCAKRTIGSEIILNAADYTPS